MEIKTGKTNSEEDAPAVAVPPDRGRPARRKHAHRPQHSRPLGARLRRLGRMLVLLIFVALLAVTGFSTYRYVNSASLLTLRDVSVFGCTRSDPDAIAAIVHREFNTNILRIDLKRLRSRLQQETWIRRAELRRILPGSLQIYVQERVPSVIAELGGELALLDEEGFLLDHNDPAYGKLDVPVFTGLRGDDAASYKVMQEENSSKVRVGVQVLAELASGSPDYARAVSEIDLSDPANIKLMLVDDTAEVFLGDRDFLKRFQMLMSSQEQYQELKAQGREIASVDLRFDSQIVFRPRPPAAEQAEPKPKVIRN
jgi:cell division protein FtsQ